MTVAELVNNIAKRLNDETGLMFSDSLIKEYLFKAIGVVFLSDTVGIEDYPGLITTETVSGSSYAFSAPIRDIVFVEGESGTIRYIRRTSGQIEAIVGKDWLNPQEGERYYYLVGKTFYLYGDAGADSYVRVKVLNYPTELSDSVNISSTYSDSFIELSTREAIKQMLLEIDVRS